MAAPKEVNKEPPMRRSSKSGSATGTAMTPRELIDENAPHSPEIYESEPQNRFADRHF
ncbi:unnamed protein product [Gongylonema pulchrum]|uniref:Uncharacterized protein n=1 Tax=Gongylonema pulchrum TaxID=637853 RepID=A0A183EPI7_9BILA|nr:unnamed protein product [Gongylonema pulchrum]